MDAVTPRLLGRTGKAQRIDQTVSDLLTLGSGPGNELRIDSRTLSRRHAQIVRSGTQYFIEDVGSRNGTFLNGQRVKRFPIRNLDVISLGPDIDLVFVETGAPAVAVLRVEPPRASVEWLDGPLAGCVEEITPGTGLVLGRTARLEAIGAMSRRHAAFTLRGDRVTVEDLGSANGTLVNGAPISAVTPLAAGDEVSLGGVVRLRLSVGAAVAAVTPAAGTAAETIFVDADDPAAARPLDVPRTAPLPPAEPIAAPPPLPPPEPIVPVVAPSPVPAAGESATVFAPREAMVAPRFSSSAAPKNPVAHPAPAAEEGRTVMAPREAAIAPHVSGPAPASRPADSTFSAPREPAAPVPDGLAARARAARQLADATSAASNAAEPPAAEPPAAEPDATLAQTTSVSPVSGQVSGVVLDGPTRETLNLGTFEIGRHADADVVVDSRDISRRHARLHVSEDQVQLEDLGTANGTFIDDAAITGLAIVPDGSRIRFASVPFAVMYVRRRGPDQ